MAGAAKKTSRETARGPRRRSNVDRSRQRAQILDAAISAPNEFGYGAVTNDVVARLAGVSRGAMNHHLPARRELLARRQAMPMKS